MIFIFIFYYFILAQKSYFLKYLIQKIQTCYNQSMKSFIHINEPFVCQNCGHKNPKSDKSCRNHCRKCLFSLHVDKNSPGDRLSDCHELMEPISISQNSKKGWMIHHKCLKCGKEIPNKAAPDDDFEKIIELSKK